MHTNSMPAACFQNGQAPVDEARGVIEDLLMKLKVRKCIMLTLEVVE